MSPLSPPQSPRRSRIIWELGPSTTSSSSKAATSTFLVTCPSRLSSNLVFWHSLACILSRYVQYLVVSFSACNHPPRGEPSPPNEASYPQLFTFLRALRTSSVAIVRAQESMGAPGTGNNSGLAQQQQMAVSGPPAAATANANANAGGSGVTPSPSLKKLKREAAQRRKAQARNLKMRAEEQERLQRLVRHSCCSVVSFLSFTSPCQRSQQARWSCLPGAPCPLPHFHPPTHAVPEEENKRKKNRSSCCWQCRSSRPSIRVLHVTPPHSLVQRTGLGFQ